MDKRTMSELKVSKDLIWANEILDVHVEYGNEINPEVLTTSSARRLHRWINADEKNEMKFIADMVPKAAAIIEKNAPKDVSDAVHDIDMKTISELQRHLTVAVRASTSPE
jgi:hypothetical protein